MAEDHQLIFRLEKHKTFEHVTVNRTTIRDAFNMDDTPKAEHLRPCLPFQAKVLIKGLHIVQCEILSVPESLQVMSDPEDYFPQKDEDLDDSLLDDNN